MLASVSIRMLVKPAYLVRRHSKRLQSARSDVRCYLERHQIKLRALCDDWQARESADRAHSQGTNSKLYVTNFL